MIALAGAAHAQPSYFVSPSAPPAEADGPFVFVAPQFGFGAPLGLFGIEAGVGAGWFRGGIGAGLGLGGLELGAMVRAMTEVSGLDLGLGVGVSRGGGVHQLRLGWRDAADPDFDPQFASQTLWLNTEAVVELPLPAGAFTRFYAGVSYAASIACVEDYTNGGPDRPCDSSDRFQLEQDPWTPYVGVAGGFRFPQPPRSRGTWQFPVDPTLGPLRF